MGVVYFRGTYGIRTPGDALECYSSHRHHLDLFPSSLRVIFYQASLSTSYWRCFCWAAYFARHRHFRNFTWLSEPHAPRAAISFSACRDRTAVSRTHKKIALESGVAFPHSLSCHIFSLACPKRDPIRNSARRHHRRPEYLFFPPHLRHNV